MKVGVVGLWHLGSVTAACLAAAGHQVDRARRDASTIAGAARWRAAGRRARARRSWFAGWTTGRLDIHDRASGSGADADVVWIAYDTPVDDEDRADVELVSRRSARCSRTCGTTPSVLVSSQLPVGSTRRLERGCARAARPARGIAFACSPENLRLGKAIEVFPKPDRVVVGARTPRDPRAHRGAARTVHERLEWMSVESAEMTKHALNAFLATSVTFINEIATICERVGRRREGSRARAQERSRASARAPTSRRAARLPAGRSPAMSRSWSSCRRAAASPLPTRSRRSAQATGATRAGPCAAARDPLRQLAGEDVAVWV